MLSDDLRRIVEARHHDPFSVLGLHPIGDGQERLTVFLPRCQSVVLSALGESLQRIDGTDLFTWRGTQGTVESPVRLRVVDDHGHSREIVDPYSFAPQIGEFDLHMFNEGRHLHAYRFLGAHTTSQAGIAGVRFAVWAPNAERVSVVGDFNHWDGRMHPMCSLGASGVWTLFIPELGNGERYKYEIKNRQNGALLTKIDPYGRAFERRPDTAGLISSELDDQWGDADWMRQRESADWLRQPYSIYEVHLGSWKRQADGGFINYRDLARELVAYARDHGFTHLELLPVMEHPLDASWGYQVTGFFAPTSRFGTPEDFRWFVDHAHQNGIGVILDWVPGHFPRDAFALGGFDGSALYEHPDPRRGEHRDWGTYIFDYGRPEVRSFLLANAFYWLEEFHVDGLRVDAVASMIYLDYSREEGDWLPNVHGGNENLDAISFLQLLNEELHRRYPGVVVIAEESTSWPKVSHPVDAGGLGFSMKWNMGWMHDTLDYAKKDPVHRSFHHDKFTFGLMYAFTENFVLPLSHDEVVHLKGSLMQRMPGDEWQRFATLRLLFTAMWTYPGKKLLFMGGEFGQYGEWNFDQSLDWHLLDSPGHRELQALVRDLNRLYVEQAPLHQTDFDSNGFQWMDCDDVDHSVFSYVRRTGNQLLVVVLNFTPVPRDGFRIGVPENGHYRECLNSDSAYYGGGNLGNGMPLRTLQESHRGQPFCLDLQLPPLAGLVLIHESD